MLEIEQWLLLLKVKILLILKVNDIMISKANIIKALKVIHEDY